MELNVTDFYQLTSFSMTSLTSNSLILLTDIPVHFFIQQRSSMSCEIVLQLFNTFTLTTRENVSKITPMTLMCLVENKRILTILQRLWRLVHCIVFIIYKVHTSK